MQLGIEKALKAAFGEQLKDIVQVRCLLGMGRPVGWLIGGIALASFLAQRPDFGPTAEPFAPQSQFYAGIVDVVGWLGAEPWRHVNIATITTIVIP